MAEEVKDGVPRWDAAVRSESLSLSIVRQIREALFDGRLSPGDFLGGEIALGQQFGVSRMAARDALRSLAAMGIVEIRMGSRGGAWVATGNPELLVDALAVQIKLIGVLPSELLDAQGALSVVAAELAADHASEDDIAHMRSASRATESAGDDPRAFTTSSLLFHESIIKAARNRVLLAQFRAMESVLQPLLVAHTSPVIVRRVLKSNALLLKAIASGDVAGAGRVMRERVAATRSKIMGLADRPSGAGKVPSAAE